MSAFGVEEEGVLFQEINLAQVKQEREFNTVLSDRYPEDYRELLKEWREQ